jgi:hypothetical protein
MKLLRRLLFGAFLLLVFAMLLGLGYRYYIEHRAKSLLADVKALRIGESDFADGMRIAQRYRRFRVKGNASVPASLDPAENVFPENVCTSDRCFFEFIIDNRPLSTLRLMDGAAFTATFAVLHGRVQYAEVYLVGGPSPGVNGGIIQEINPPADRWPGYQFRTPVGAPYLRVVLTPAAPSSMRERAFAIDIHCLVAFRICDSACQYLPLLWNDWKAEMDRDGWSERIRVAYPHCP